MNWRKVAFVFFAVFAAILIYRAWRDGDEWPREIEIREVSECGAE
jgi:hypothetical protein